MSLIEGYNSYCVFIACFLLGAIGSFLGRRLAYPIPMDETEVISIKDRRLNIIFARLFALIGWFSFISSVSAFVWIRETLNLFYLKGTVIIIFGILFYYYIVLRILIPRPAERIKLILHKTHRQFRLLDFLLFP